MPCVDSSSKSGGIALGLGLGLVTAAGDAIAQELIARTFLARIEGLVASEDLGARELKGIPKPVAGHNLTQLNLAGAAV